MSTNIRHDFSLVFEIALEGIVHSIACARATSAIIDTAGGAFRVRPKSRPPTPLKPHGCIGWRDEECNGSLTFSRSAAFLSTVDDFAV